MLRFVSKAAKKLLHGVAHAFRNRRATSLKLFIVVVLAGAFLYLLFRYPIFRPYLIAIVAAIGSLFTAMPELLSRGPIVRWISATMAGICIGVGTWYTAEDLESKLQKLQTRFEAKTQALDFVKFHMQSQAFDPEAKNKFLSDVALKLREQLRQKNFSVVDELSRLILEINPENGHGLYFGGEYWRVTNDRVQMRGHFYRYFSSADRIPESHTGVGMECYKRPAGYCAERTAWINHLMANDFYQEAHSEKDSRKTAAAYIQACKFVKATNENFSGGFTQLVPTMVLREEIMKALVALHREKEAIC